jgi:hypothetical protein
MSHKLILDKFIQAHPRYPLLVGSKYFLWWTYRLVVG